MVSGQEHLVCRLKKSLYGLKQAPRQWYRKFDDFIRSIGFSKSDEDHCLFTKTAQDGSPIFLIIYVDDMLISGRHAGELAELVRQLRLKFAMKDLGPARHILGMKISRNRDRRQLFLSQSDYIGRVLERFNMHSAKSASTPLPINTRLSRRDCPTSGPEGEIMKSVPYAPAVGSLMYAMVATRPDIAHAVGVVSRFMHNPGRSHWNAVKHVFRYLAGTQDLGILFGPNDNSGVVGYTDSDFAGCVDSRKSTTGYCFKFGNGVISWKSKLQECTATSTTEAEYVAASDAAKEALWLGRMACVFRQAGIDSTPIVYSDSQGAVALSKNPPSISTFDIISFETASFQERSALRRYLRPIMSQMH